jgi:hypothetical protein
VPVKTADGKRAKHVTFQDSQLANDEGEASQPALQSTFNKEDDRAKPGLAVKKVGRRTTYQPRMEQATRGSPRSLKAPTNKTENLKMSQKRISRFSDE